MYKIIYFHGFGSSGEEETVRTLKELLPDWIVIAPDIPVDPKDALRFLKNLCMKEQPEVILGTGLGGMYAAQMHGFKRICVNPTFNISKHKDILREGKFEFLNSRKNGETNFTITPKIIEHFVEMEAHQFECITDEDRNNVYGHFDFDKTFKDIEDIYRRHYSNYSHFIGKYGLTRQIIENELLPQIKYKKFIILERKWFVAKSYDEVDYFYVTENPTTVFKLDKNYIYRDKLFMCPDANCIIYKHDRIIIDNILKCVQEIGSTGKYTIYTLFPDGRVEKDIEKLDIGGTQHDYYDYMEPTSCFYMYFKDEEHPIGFNEVYFDENEMNIVWFWLKKIFSTNK